MNPVTKVMAWLIHPVLLGSMAGLHILMSNSGYAVPVSAYVPILLAAAVVSLLEHLMPYRRNWRPDRFELRTDIAYMAVVQLAMPKMLALTVGLLTLQQVDALHLVVDLWPEGLPLCTQVLLVCLALSFIRYWTHRAGHAWRPLWKLHAVHHSSDKLYWLNLSRFHPLEQILRFVSESLPLMVLGVSQEALAFYFVILSVNGFLFHSNIRLKHGILNHVFATAELHRWHHARDPNVAACNYGNLLIIWDALFGTRFLPSEREVGTLGLDDDYPKHFAAQILAPFFSRPIYQDITGSYGAHPARQYPGRRK